MCQIPRLPCCEFKKVWWLQIGARWQNKSWSERPRAIFPNPTYPCVWKFVKPSAARLQNPFISAARPSRPRHLNLCAQKTPFEVNLNISAASNCLLDSFSILRLPSAYSSPGLKCCGCPWPTLAKKVGMTLIPTQFCDSAHAFSWFCDTVMRWQHRLGNPNGKLWKTRLHDTVELFYGGQRPQFRPQ